MAPLKAQTFLRPVPACAEDQQRPPPRLSREEPDQEMLSLTMQKPPENFVTADPPTSSWSKPDRLTKSSFEEP
ncbi:MAG: hypothetical protein QF412_03655, partial [Planctomycetota bacterium]|nr:hypothetical protein [Planctomycetota bacterium]